MEIDIFMDPKHPIFWGVQLYMAILKGVSRHLGLHLSCLGSSGKTFAYIDVGGQTVLYISLYIAEMY